MNRLLVSPAPHLHTKTSTMSLMRDVVIALLPTVIVSILFSLVALYLVLRLMFTVLAYVDDSSLGVFDAIQRSWSMTHGNMGKIILAVLMMIVLNIIGFIALIVGIVVTLIISAFMIVALYEQIKASEQLAVADEAAAAAEPAQSEPENPAQPQ